jgi:GTP-binding protein
MAHDSISAQFLLGAAKPEQFPDHSYPEVAMVGRSNVGKSSLINAILRTGMVARVSQTPGKTQEANFFLTDLGVCFVDLPGYGYAAVSKVRRGEFSTLIQAYVAHRMNVRTVIALIDARHDPMPMDLSMLESLEFAGKPFVVALTKCDKLRDSDVEARTEQVRGVVSQCRFAIDVVATSASTGLGRQSLIGIIKRARDNQFTPS